MKNKKGFTLIEILAVVIILGILLVIAVPTVRKYMIKGTNSYYNSIEEEIKTSGMDYLETYRTLLPKQIGHVAIVELDELVENKYIDQVKDENGNVCTGKVTVKKVKTDKYKYYSCLQCGDLYQSKSSDCSYSETDNIYPDTGDYRIVLDQTSYTVNQTETIILPKAKVYHKDELLIEDLEGKPSTIDTNKLGTITITYYYHGAKQDVTIEVVDSARPTMPQIVLKYDDETGNNYKGDWYSKNIYAMYKSTDYVKTGIEGSGIKEYQVSSDGINFVSITGDSELLTNQGRYTRYVRSVDNNGNISEANNYEIKIDKVIPSPMLITASDSKYSSAWHNSNYNLEFNYTGTANISGNKYYYGINEAPGNEINIPYTTAINSNTSSTIYYAKVCSGAGVCSNVTNYEAKLDTVIPDPPSITASDGIASGGWHNRDFQLTFTYNKTRNISGNTFYYGIDTPRSTMSIPNVVNVTTNTTGTTYYSKAASTAGLESNLSNYVIRLDKVTPTCGLRVKSGTLGKNSWYISNVEVEFSTTDGTGSEIVSQSINYPTITANGTYSVVGTVTDQAGNIGNCYLTVNVDKDAPSAPTISATDGKASDTWHTGDFSLVFSGANNVSGNTYYYRDNASITFGTDGLPNTGTASSNKTLAFSTETTSYTYYAVVCAGNGLCSGNSSYLIKLDKSNPIISNVSHTGSHGETFSANCSDPQTGVVNSFVSSTISGSGYVTLTCRNGVGFTSTYTHQFRYNGCKVGEDTCEYGCDEDDCCTGSPNECRGETIDRTCSREEEDCSTYGYWDYDTGSYGECDTTTVYYDCSYWDSCADTVNTCSSCEYNCDGCYYGHDTCESGWDW